MSWECVKRRKGNCKAQLKLSVTEVYLASVNEHSPVSSKVQCEVAKVKARTKRRAESTNETTQQVLAGELMGISESAAANLPPLHHMRRIIHSQ